MIKKGKIGRRSFLTLVTGGAIAFGAAATVTSGAAFAQVTDSDTGSSADPAGRGRGSSGLTDSDSGSYADTAGRGRGGSGGSGGSDRAGGGSRCSDTDTGGRADPGGRGRRCSDSD